MQHMGSPVHRKAVERQRAEQDRRVRMMASGYNQVAEAALEAAAWNSSTHVPGGAGSGGGGGGGGKSGFHRVVAPKAQQGQRQQRKGPAHGEQDNSNVQKPAAMTHAELVAQMTSGGLEGDDGPPSIDGWVPPSVAVAAPPLPVIAGGVSADDSLTSSDEDGDQDCPPSTLSKADLPQPTRGGYGLPQSAASDEASYGPKSEGLLGLGYSSSADDDSSSDGSSEGDEGGAAGKSFF